MSNVISDWRAAVVAYLREEFPRAEVVDGPRDGVSRRQKALIAVYWPGWEWVPRDQALASPTLSVRYWPSRSKQPLTSTPDDPAELEQAAVDLMLAFQAKQKGGDFVANLSCGLRSCTPNYDPDEWRVDGVLEAFTLHLARSAA